MVFDPEGFESKTSFWNCADINALFIRCEPAFLRPKWSLVSKMSYLIQILQYQTAFKYQRQGSVFYFVIFVVGFHMLIYT